jgi:ATP synthase protein I
MSERPSGGGASTPDRRLSELGRKLKGLRRAETEPGQASRRGTQLGFAFRLATELVAGFVVGGFIGWTLDEWLGTMPLFLLVFFGLGAAAGILNVVRTAHSMNQAAQREAGPADEAREPPSRDS